MRLAVAVTTVPVLAPAADSPFLNLEALVLIAEATVLRFQHLLLLLYLLLQLGEHRLEVRLLRLKRGAQEQGS